MLQEIGFPWFILGGIAHLFVLAHNKHRGDNAVGFQLSPKTEWLHKTLPANNATIA